MFTLIAGGFAGAGVTRSFSFWATTSVDFAELADMT